MTMPNYSYGLFLTKIHLLKHHLLLCRKIHFLSKKNRVIKRNSINSVLLPFIETHSGVMYALKVQFGLIKTNLKIFKIFEKIILSVVVICGWDDLQSNSNLEKKIAM